MEAETIETILTKEPECFITSEPSFTERFIESPASTLVEEVSKLATRAVDSAAESINSGVGIHGNNIDGRPSVYIPSYHWFGYAALAGLAVAAAYGIKKWIDHHKNSDKYLMKSLKKAYERSLPNHKKSSKGVKKKIARFNAAVDSLFSDFSRTYQNKALRMVLEGVMQSDNPYDAIRNVRDELKPGMTGTEIVAKAAKLVPNGAEIRANYDTQYQSEEAFVRLISRKPA